MSNPTTINAGWKEDHDDIVNPSTSPCHAVLVDSGVTALLYPNLATTPPESSAPTQPFKNGPHVATGSSLRSSLLPRGNTLGTKRCGGTSETQEEEEVFPSSVVSPDQLDALAAFAYLVGSPLQPHQPGQNCAAAAHPSLLVVAQLLQYGVDPERIIEIIQGRYA